MSQDKQLKPIAEASIGRRTFINTAALASLAGVAACTDKPTSAAAPAASAPAVGGGVGANASHLKPGELDTYYGLWNGGHTGDMRVPAFSPRGLQRHPSSVPVQRRTRCCARRL